MTFRRFLFRGLPVALLMGLALSGCKDDFDEYYERPGWLESSSIDVLKDRNDCKTYLQLVEKTLFSKQLEGSGSYTFFVPTDQAFAEFFANNPYGYKSVADIPADVASEMVSYTMLYNQYPCDSLGHVLTGYNEWIEGGAFRHCTPAYETLQRDFVDGDSIWVFDNPTNTWSNSWHNYRWLPVFSKSYFSDNGLQESDYLQFYPNATWSSYGNMIGAGILDANAGYGGDLFCQNGVIHLVDKVQMPLKNFDRMIRDYGEMTQDNPLMPTSAKQGAWAELKHFLYHKDANGYMFLSYNENANAKHYYEKMYPGLDLSSFRLRSTKNLPFVPFSESYTGTDEADQKTVSSQNSSFHAGDFNSGHTLFLPTTNVMRDYVDNRILAYVSDKSDWDAAFNTLSSSVLPTLMSTLFSNGIVWPTHFGVAQNEVGSNEYIQRALGNGDFGSVVVASDFASNGAYHIVNSFPKTAAFEGVGSRFLLDPAYSYAELVYSEMYAYSIYQHMLMSAYTNMANDQFNVILASDDNLRDWWGVYYDAADARFENSDGSDASSAISTMFQRSFIERDTTDRLDFEVDPLNGAYDGWGYTNTFYGDVIRYKRTGRTVQGKPEIMVQSIFGLRADVQDQADAEGALPSYMPQTMNPSEGTYTSVIKDPTYDNYINGNVFVATENAVPLSYTASSNFEKNSVTYFVENNSTSEIPDFINAYLVRDSLQGEGAQHTIFYEYWKYATGRKKAGWTAQAPPSFPSSGRFTILIPTDKALQHAIDQGLMYDPAIFAVEPTTEINWCDTATIFLNAYFTINGMYPDDGAGYIYTRDAWELNSGDLMGEYEIGTSYKPMTDEWEDFMSGTARVNMRITKVGDGECRFLGVNRVNSGGHVMAKAINGSEMSDESGMPLFTNTVVRKLGQSNVIGPRCIIHSLDGFIIYKLQLNPAKH